MCSCVFTAHAQACWATRASNGGLMELPALLKYVNRRRGTQADPISEDDVVGGSVAQHFCMPPN